MNLRKRARVNDNIMQNIWYNERWKEIYLATWDFDLLLEANPMQMNVPFPGAAYQFSESLMIGTVSAQQKVLAGRPQ